MKIQDTESLHIVLTQVCLDVNIWQIRRIKEDTNLGWLEKNTQRILDCGKQVWHNYLSGDPSGLT